MKAYTPFNFSALWIKFEILKIIAYFGSTRNTRVILCFVTDCPLLASDSFSAAVEFLPTGSRSSLS